MLRYNHFLLLSDPEPKQSSSDRERLVQTQWVKYQCNWFRKQVDGCPKKKKRSLRDRIKIQKFCAAFLFITGLLMTVPLLIDSKWDFIPESYQWILRGLMAFFPVCAGVIRFHLEITGLEESAEQYERILAVYDKACRLLNPAPTAAATTTPPKSEVYFHLGCATLSEQGDWLLFNRHKEAGPAG